MSADRGQRFCIHCGTAWAEGGAFCANCGQASTGTPAAPGPPAPATNSPTGPANAPAPAPSIRSFLVPAGLPPFILLVIMAGVMTKVVPIFERMFGEVGAALPVPTQILITMSHTTTHYFFHSIILAPFVVVPYLAALRWLHSRFGRKALVIANLLWLAVFVGSVPLLVLALYQPIFTLSSTIGG